MLKLLIMLMLGISVYSIKVEAGLTDTQYAKCEKEIKVKKDKKDKNTPKVSMGSFFSQNSPLGQAFDKPTAIAFLIPQFTPVGIEVEGVPQGTQFRICRDGLYSIGWTMTLKNTGRAPQFVELQLVEGHPPIALLPNPLQTATVQGLDIVNPSFATMSGHVKMKLKKNDVISFVLVPQGAGISYINPSFQIIEIIHHL